MLSFVRRWLSLALVALGALGLRTHDLARRPMHADEANQAVKLGHLLESGDYTFDPRDHHGPTLYYLALPVAWVRGEHRLAELTETTVRLLPALFGVAVVLLTAALAAPLGRGPAWSAAALVALSPPAVYYSRYFIQETLLVAFTLAALVCAQRWWRSGRPGWAVATGVCAGLMQATKATAPLFAAAAGVALLTLRPPSMPPVRAWWRHAALALGAALVVGVLGYTSFGAHLAGLRDAFATFAPMLARATDGAGHEKPWWYYASLFLAHREGGFVFGQALFFALALAGLVIAMRAAPRTGGRLLRFVAVSTAFLAVVFSITPYKTPWIVVNLVPGLAVLAVGALAALAERGVWGRAAAAALFVGVVAWQAWQVRRVVFQLPADPRNPFAYVHSSPDVRKVRSLAAVALRHSPDGVIKVISEEYWPLPWYLRDHPRVGYWFAPPDDCDAALVISSAGLAVAVRSRLRGEYRESYLGLRPGFVLVVFTPE